MIAVNLHKWLDNLYFKQYIPQPSDGTWSTSIGVDGCIEIKCTFPDGIQKVNICVSIFMCVCSIKRQQACSTHAYFCDKYIYY